MHTTRTRHAVTASILAAVTTAALVACTPSEPEEPAPIPTPSQTASATAEPEPEPEPSETVSEEDAAQQANIDAAKARYAEYRDAVSAALNAGGGFDALSDLLPYLGSDETITWWRSITEQYEDLGLEQVGEREVVSITAIDYDGDPLSDDGTQEVDFEVCLDSSDVDVVREDGSSAIGAESPDRQIDDVVLRRQADGRWTVMVDKTREPWEEC